MLTYIVRRLLAMGPLLVAVSLIIFGMVNIAPGDPAITLVGGRRTSAETLANIRARYNLDKPLPVQYWLWLGRAVHGDLGESYRHRQQVTALIIQRLPITLKLATGSILISLIVAFPLGVFTAVHQNTTLGHIGTLLMLLGVSTPVFFSAVLVILVFAFWLGWLPAFGIGRGLLEQFRHLILPCLVLGLSMVALIGRMIRSQLIETLNLRYITTARAKGLSEKTVILKHALRNALIPAVTVLGITSGYLLIGAVLVEHAFGIAGLGALLINAILDSDYPIVQGVTLCMSVVFLGVNLVVDIVYAILDPRIHYG